MMARDEAWQEVPVRVKYVMGRPPVAHASIARSNSTDGRPHVTSMLLKHTVEEMPF